MTDIETLRELLAGRDCEDTTFFTNPDYATAIMGLSDDDRVIYSYDDMVKYLMDMDGMEYDEAMEFIDYNTIRTIPYTGEKAPIICYSIE